MAKPQQGTYVSYADTEDHVRYGGNFLSGSTPSEGALAGDPGESSEAARADHVHAHGDLSDSGTHFHDTDQIEDLSGIGAANVSDALDQLNAAIPVLNEAYGDMYENTPGAPTNIAIALIATWYPWISATGGQLDQITFNDDNVNGDYLEIPAGFGGDYEVMLTGSFSGSANALLRVYVFVNGLISRIGISRKLSAGGDVGSFAATGILGLSAGDELRVKVSSTTAPETYGSEILNLAVHKVNI